MLNAVIAAGSLISIASAPPVKPPSRGLCIVYLYVAPSLTPTVCCFVPLPIFSSVSQGGPCPPPPIPNPVFVLRLTDPVVTLPSLFLQVHLPVSCPQRPPSDSQCSVSPLTIF